MPRPSDFRGTVIAEDRRTERFFREVLKRIGFDIKRKVNFIVAPRGQNGEQFVRAQYPINLQKLRSRSYQANLFLLVVIDGDVLGRVGRQNQLAAAIEAEGVELPQGSERAEVIVPCRNIETWLLHLLDSNPRSETEDFKSEFDSYYKKTERVTLKSAADKLYENGTTDSSPESLVFSWPRLKGLGN